MTHLKKAEKRKVARNVAAGYNVDDVARDQMRAIYQLKDHEFRKTVDAKYRKSSQVNWKNACDQENGYGALKGSDNKTMRNFYDNFQKIRRGEEKTTIDTLAQLEEYIKNDGKFGKAAGGHR